MTSASSQSFPYRRDFRPVSADGLGAHVDRENEKIEIALAQIAADIADIKRRLTAAGIL